MKYNVKKKQKYGKLIVEKVKGLFNQLEISLNELNIFFENSLKEC